LVQLPAGISAILRALLIDSPGAISTSFRPTQPPVASATQESSGMDRQIGDVLDVDAEWAVEQARRIRSR